MSYLNDAASDAKAWIIDEMIPEVVERVLGGQGVQARHIMSIDSVHEYFCEHITDRCYNFQEAMEILDDLEEYEETDTGIWEGVSGFKAQAIVCAAYTYGNAVSHFAHRILDDLIDRLESELDELEDRPEGEEEMSEDAKSESLDDLAREYVRGW